MLPRTVLSEVKGCIQWQVAGKRVVYRHQVVLGRRTRAFDHGDDAADADRVCDHGSAAVVRTARDSDFILTGCDMPCFELGAVSDAAIGQDLSGIADEAIRSSVVTIASRQNRSDEP